MLCLPREVVLNILNQLRITTENPGKRTEGKWVPSRDKCKTLHSIALVNRELHDLANPELYHTICSWSCEPKQTINLIRTLARRPDLAQLVKQVCWHEGLALPTYGVSRLSDDLYHELGPISAKLLLPEHLQSKTSEQLRHGYKDAQFVFLISLCRNLRLLSIRTWSLSSLATQVISEYSRNAVARLPGTPLAYVQDAILKHQPSKNPGDLEDLVALLCLPLLRSLIGEDINITGSRFPQLSQNRLASSVRHIRLNNCTIDGEGVNSLFESCPVLQALSLIWNVGGGSYDVEIPYLNIGQALRNAKLLSFALDTQHVNEDTKRSGKIGSLAVTCLQNMSLNLTALLGDTEVIHRWEVHGTVPYRAEYNMDMRERRVYLPETVVMHSLVEILPTTLSSLTITNARVVDSFRGRVQTQINELLNSSRFSGLTKVRLEDCNCFEPPYTVQSWHVEAPSDSTRLIMRIQPDHQLPIRQM